MTHEYNIRSKMVDTVATTEEDLTRLQQNITGSLKGEISNGNSSLKDEINNLKDTVIKRLQEENQNLRQKYNKLEAKIVKLETEQNSLAQNGRRNNIVISGIPDSIDDNNLENTVISMISDTNVNIEENDIEVCHRFGKPDVKSKSKKIVVRFVNRKNCNKIFENKNKLKKLNNELAKSSNEKHNFREGTKVFVNESLTPMNDFIAFNYRKLKREELIHSCCSRNGVLIIKMTNKSRPAKIFHMENLLNLFSDFDFEAGEMYLDTSQDTDASVHSTY